MKSKRETIVLICIVIGSLMIGSAVAPYILRDAASTRRMGDPNDVTGLVPREALLGPEGLRRGPESAPFKLIEFADYQCASCGKAESVIRGLLSKRSDLALHFRHYPLASEHQYAEHAAHAAEVARAMGKGLEMHQALYDKQEEWSTSGDIRTALIEIAESVGLDGAKFGDALDASKSGRIQEKVAADRQLGELCSVESTPSFFLVTPKRIWAAVGPVGLERLAADPKYWD